MYRGTLNHQVLIFRVKLNDAILQEFRVSLARTVHSEFQRFPPHIRIVRTFDYGFSIEASNYWETLEETYSTPSLDHTHIHMYIHTYIRSPYVRKNPRERV